MAFYANTDTAKAAKKSIDIYFYDIKAGEVKKAAYNQMAGLQEGWIVSENGQLSFSKDGKRLFFAQLRSHSKRTLPLPNSNSLSSTSGLGMKTTSRLYSSSTRTAT